VGALPPEVVYRLVVRMAVDGRAFASPAGGVRRYVSELYTALATLDPDLRVDAVGAAPASVLPSSCDPRAEWPSPPTNLGRHAVGLPLTLARGGYAVYHAPAYVAPTWGRVPIVLSVHDISYASRPEWYPYRRDALRRWFYRQSIERARLIVVPSTFTADEIMRVYAVRADRLRLVPLAPSGLFHHPQPPGPAQRSRVLLHVGDLHARRDLITAVAVLRLLVTTDSSPWRLVLIGQDRGSWGSIHAAAVSAGVAQRIDRVEAASDDVLRGWYERSWCLLYPSRYEGFGLPVAEAMAAGLPVVAADAGSVPEVLSGAGALFPAGDTERALASVVSLEDPETYRGSQALGLTRARALTWSGTARLTREALDEAARA
jgi:glycosyltransferase involved in cell wall biosynthesis